MPGSLRALRRRILTPDVMETKLEKRGFHVKNDEARELLERIGETFLRGYALAAEARTPAEAEEQLEEIPPRFRGFAYEGAGMAFTILDALPFGSGRGVDGFLRGRGNAHIYMIYVGIGWGMARLPRFLWPKSATLDPLLLWLVHDGYGFHQAYFHTERYVTQQFQDSGFPWPAGRNRGYAGRAIDQGIGRALWFVGGTDVEKVVSMVEKFPRARRADLFSGVGLAATYAGGGAEDELRELRERAGHYRPQLAQGSVFAAEARVRAGLVVPHNEIATQVFCGSTPEQAARLSLDTRPAGAVPGVLPAYEMWRQRVADQLISLGGVSP
ncbi:DUF1702 family protein [Planomonospora sp. ID67723]|uniref:DUF1702 family protein n=1 Tax=Planomonospora sp. ID67723 TaxID=2738134 RepID=UPI001A1E14C5|nr:DUF1702 family protein [Planomonospora sp. ID67723]MBG0829058.1 DUF1702 family protein [Planomonospora sp. ID67723]